MSGQTCKESKFWIVVAIVLGVAIITLALWRVAAPQLVVDTEVDFGNVLTPYERSLILENTGLRPLIISELDTDCSCVVLLDGQLTILPGKTAALPLQFKAAEELSIEADSMIVFKTNDPNRPVVQVRIVASVVSRISLNPSYWVVLPALGESFIVEKPSKEFRIQCSDPIRDLRVLTAPNFMSYNVEPLSPNVFSVTINLNVEDLAQEFIDMVTFEIVTDKGELFRKDISVAGVTHY